jgi:enoyl-CoA hydratase
MIEVEMRGPVAVVQMRHGKANTLDVEFCTALAQRLDELRGSARAIVLTGQGSIFSAGVDLVRVITEGASYVDRFLPSLGRLFETVLTFPAPVVAAVNGHAIAGGCIVACAADHRIMARDTGRIGVPELLVGVPFPSIALEIMRAATAPHHLQTLVYTGVTLPAEEAIATGMVHVAVESAQLLERATATATSLAAIPQAAFSATKKQVYAPVLERVRAAASSDARMLELWRAPETLEAIRAYVQRTLKR